MKKLALTLLTVLALTGCGTPNAPMYEASNYRTEAWASKQFGEAKAKCRHDNLSHNKVWDTYELDKVKFEACMEKYGFDYTAKTDWMGNVHTNPVAPVAPASAPIDKSALYQ